ncbi:unnamed protein product [Lepeophtheirus salmonis]|uniref:(salmon louse) hypothetical protein n=1 Tax=Lepeophtheirus salmonis TaxID=72036 RepID=A0A7R8CR68_LEPSM|nr:unnamed protein product [Lepeophtheirus salmonis]CAF2868133.1 unnamed protein product [Lepeophtheirus salmonis]
MIIMLTTFGENVAITSQKSLYFLESFGEDFVMDNFYQNDFWKHHETWKDLKSDWILNQFKNAELSQVFDTDHVLTMNEEELMKRVLSGILRAQLLIDIIARTRRDSYQQYFFQSSINLSTILLEFKDFEMFDEIKRLKNQKRIEKHFLSMSSGMRDWIAYRDTRILLETIVQISKTLAEKESIREVEIEDELDTLRGESHGQIMNY